MNLGRCFITVSDEADRLTAVCATSRRKDVVSDSVHLSWLSALRKSAKLESSDDHARRIFGDIGNQIVSEILSSGTTMFDQWKAPTYLAQKIVVMGELERPSAGTALTT